MRDTQIAIQVGAVSFVDETVDEVLDNVQTKGEADTLFLANFTYTRGTGGRVLEGQPFPDHGEQTYDPEFKGGAYFEADPTYYRNTFIEPSDYRAKELGNFDILADVVPEARRRGLLSYAWIEESSGLRQAEDISNYWSVLQEDARGRKSKRPCFNNPDYRNWHLGMVEDTVRSHDLDGVAWASERQGPVGSVMLEDGPWASESQPTCFCAYCRAEANQFGIDIERARTGMLKLKDFMIQAREGQRPRDGYFVTFWRLLIEYPEILQMERLWNHGQQGFYKDVYGLVKSVAPKVQVGWHIFHMNAFSPFYRATQDMAEMAHYSDFIKLVAYNACAGPRFADYMAHLHATIFCDAPPDVGAVMVQSFLGVKEPSLEDGIAEGWSPDFVARETRRALAAVAEARTDTKIFTGIDINIPIAEEARRFIGRSGMKTTGPEDVHAASLAALEAGADGLVLSRKYSEMPLANLEAAGDAVRRFRSRGEVKRSAG